MRTEGFIKLLESKRAELLSRQSGITEDFMAGRSTRFADQASDTENDDVLHQLKHEAEMELRQINEALHKIAKGEYGVCESCGSIIDEKRLEVVPFTRYCIRCACRF